MLKFMQKFLVILVMLSWCSNANAEKIYFECTQVPNYNSHDYARYTIDNEKNKLIVNFKWNDIYYDKYKDDEDFIREFKHDLKHYVGRTTPLYYAQNLSQKIGGAQIYLKREDLNHTGAHKINNTIGQALLAKRMGKARIIAETGAGQHGVATATVAAMFGLECVVYMGAHDCERQRLNVYRMRMLGAEVVPVEAGRKTLKEAGYPLAYWAQTDDGRGEKRADAINN